MKSKEYLDGPILLDFHLHQISGMRTNKTKNMLNIMFKMCRELIAGLSYLQSVDPIPILIQIVH